MFMDSLMCYQPAFRRARWTVRLGLGLTLSLLLTACTTYKWVHPTQKESTVDLNLLECEKQAASMYPATMVHETTGGSYQPSTTTCRTVNGASQCETRGASYTPPTTIAKDANESNRLQAKDLCMRARGWRKVEVKSP